MNYIDLTVAAGKVFQSDMTVDTLLIKLGMDVHKQRVDQQQLFITELLKYYDNPLEIQKILMDKYAANKEDLTKRGLEEKSSLILV